MIFEMRRRFHFKEYIPYGTQHTSRHHALFSYLQSRLIDADISRMYCKEVHYELRGRHYFALAFGNISGGYEVRNAYYKRCLNNKDISLIRHLTEETQENVCVFEGFMDFLSYMTLKLAGDRTEIGRAHV